MSIEFILTEAARALGQATRIAFMLFWWLGIGVVNLSRHVQQRIEENQVRGSHFTANGHKSSGVTCKVCGALNETGQSRCFVCSAQL